MKDTNLTLTSICAPSEDIVARLIEDEIVIVPLVAGIGDAEDELYTLNSTGQAIWEKLDGQLTLTQVVSSLAEQFTASHAEIEADVLGFVGEMVRRGILVVKSL